MNYVGFAFAGYILGSILFAYWIPYLVKGIDVRHVSTDANPGVYNAITAAGWGWGLFTLLLELLKGAVPVFFAVHTLDMTKIAFGLVMLAPVLGHAFPPGFGFKGGKGIAVSFGVLIGILPRWQPLAALICSYLFFSLVVRIKSHLYRSVVTYGSFIAVSSMTGETDSVRFGCVMIALVVILRHYLDYRKHIAVKEDDGLEGAGESAYEQTT